MYYDVYIRLANEKTFQSIETAGYGVLDGCYRLKLVRADAAITVEPILEDLADGTQVTKGEKVNFNAATLRVTKDTLSQIKGKFDGMLCDILFMSPHQLDKIVAVYALRLYVRVLAETGEIAQIQISGSEQMSPKASRRGVHIEDLTTNHDMGTVRGRIIDTNGDPVADALVTDQGGYYSVRSAADGEFTLVFIAGNTELYADAVGLTFKPIVLEVPELDIVDIGDWAAEV